MSITGPIKRLLPLFDRIVVQRAEAATKSKGGIIIPEKSVGKVLEATVVAAGPGARNDKGETIKMSVQVGDRVLLPEYGGTKIEVDQIEYAIFREADIVAKFGKE
uniref:10 kDa heat shock protein, mitochondrial n=1 Tax=Paracyclopina nana TaxID=565004 RepID=H2B649_PARNA